MTQPAMVCPGYSGAAAVTYAPLAAPENAPSQAQDEVEVAKKGSSLWARLGITQILILCLGSIILVIAVLPLAWLWVESMAAAVGREPSSAWVSVIEKNWTTRIVTICTAIVRAVVTAQASVATAMFAGIILERVGSPLVDGPFYSTVRALSGSPINLLWTPNLPLHRTGLSVLVVILIVLEVLVTIAVQFLSTLLVADFGNGAFTHTSNVTNIRLLNYTRDPFLGPWWSMPPSAGWAFAEQLEPPIAGPKYDDTGHTYRAFLPYLEAAQRKSLRHFRGPVPISDQRVVCVQPTIRDLRLDTASLTFPRLSGQIAIANGTYPMLRNTESQPYLPFTCALATSMSIPNQEQGLTSLCWPDYGMEWKVFVEDPLVTLGPIAYNNSMIIGYLQACTMFMLLDVVSSAGVPNNGTEEVRVLGNNDTNSSPWVMVGNGTDHPTVRVTTCIGNLGVDTFTAEIHSNWEGSEPTMSWNQPMQRYDTESMRTQLGAVRPRQPLNHRGVLALGPRSDWQPLFPDPVIPASILNVSDTNPVRSQSLGASNAWNVKGALAQILIRMQNEGTIMADPGIILTRDAPPGIYIAHEAYTSLFQDTLEQTKSPAVALQALLTLFTQMVYYDRLLRINGTDRAETAFSHTALIPTRWTGFGVGMGLLLSHWVVMAIVVGLFARYTCHSLLGNHWQAVSQVYSKDTVAVLEMADQMKDQGVEGWVKRKERGEELYSVALDEGEGGRVALTVKHSD
ncbi:hypothetical protein PCG10_002294 [Penicillium crustosum]|uniref:Uncharacterized protein n=1 Tax=Penicillium crustosum TaxID=36656 RepID=A0A9P5GS98_PENCR|nr:uncharacterized protein N7487_011324 [Penicillium crustosum]KAF7527822.1 hypothetical protein PCG10_002294 [Penicillium crustosum]KAJ5393683.1 hypothetical protein N7487_011324 [Penicillium crustosum]